MKRCVGVGGFGVKHPRLPIPVNLRKAVAFAKRVGCGLEALAEARRESAMPERREKAEGPEWLEVPEVPEWPRLLK